MVLRIVPTHAARAVEHHDRVGRLGARLVSAGHRQLEVHGIAALVARGRLVADLGAVPAAAPGETAAFHHRDVFGRQCEMRDAVFVHVAHGAAVPLAAVGDDAFDVAGAVVEVDGAA